MTSQTSELVEHSARWHAGQLRSLAHQHRKIKMIGMAEIFDGAADLLERLSSSEVTEAYCEGLLTAERMVRRCIGEDNEELIIDVDDGIPAHKPTLIYVAEALSNRAHRAAMRSAATSKEQHP